MVGCCLSFLLTGFVGEAACPATGTCESIFAMSDVIGNRRILAVRGHSLVKSIILLMN